MTNLRLKAAKMIYRFLGIAGMLLCACKNGDPEGRTIVIPMHLPQSIHDTFYYTGIIKYVAIDKERKLDSTRQEITKVFINGNGELCFSFVMTNYLPFLAEIGNPADTFSTAPVVVEFDISNHTTFVDKTKDDKWSSMLQFLKGDSLLFEEDWNFSKNDHREHWTFIGKRRR